VYSISRYSDMTDGIGIVWMEKTRSLPRVGKQEMTFISPHSLEICKVLIGTHVPSQWFPSPDNTAYDFVSETYTGSSHVEIRGRIERETFHTTLVSMESGKLVMWKRYTIIVGLFLIFFLVMGVLVLAHNDR
jgi:hypothetical protein